MLRSRLHFLYPSKCVATDHDTVRHALAVARIRCATDYGIFGSKVISGEVEKRPGSQPFLGLAFISVVLCDVHDSKVHMARLSRRLPQVLESLKSLEFLWSGPDGGRYLSLYGTVGTDDGPFVRNVCFPVDVLRMCADYRLLLAVEVVPCLSE